MGNGEMNEMKNDKQEITNSKYLLVFQKPEYSKKEYLLCQVHFPPRK